MPSLILFPRLRRNWESSRTRAPPIPSLYLLRRAGLIDWERASAENYFAANQERIIFGLWIEGWSYSICKHSRNLNFALLYFFHHPLRRHSARCLNHTRKQLFARAAESKSDASGAAPMAAPGHYIEAQEQLLLLFSPRRCGISRFAIKHTRRELAELFIASTSHTLTDKQHLSKIFKALLQLRNSLEMEGARRVGAGNEILNLICHEL